ncbi:EAL domain-containing protein [Falsibacillus pallidus]|uniref:EAL domain-containing protein (Putative c-di-GMP-specific phosphodiesterase class I) n=1 Tax=Falsibacillus pallidus TaxID=493781 RepID=A0A370GDW7_9BACI|nr:EAL domain-containing protein [Falsibacillus pallidus]RDI41877.1 EAL domain-containing protein (putative c-di-GMP-specific phosphodiesterase class I) [Falsibacillus pallidus]
MGCKGCSTDELIFEIKINEDQNQSMEKMVLEYFNRRGILVQTTAEGWIMDEDGIKDFYDFCRDHMDSESIFFRMNQEEWKPIKMVEPILSAEWIDEVIRKGMVTCFYQPIIDGDLNIEAYELLARFQREDGSMIYPNEIFSAAKTRGRLYALDRVCRMTAVRYAARLNKKAFINFIPTAIYSPEFCLRSTVSLANELGIDPSMFVFEVVESEQVEDLNHLKRILSYYKEKGFKYALDDVGEGFSTLEALEELSPNYMKLDMKYVQGVAKDEAKQAMAMKFLKAALDVEAVPLAEGVETEEDFHWLKQNGYQLFQGYLFGKPSPNPLSKVEGIAV